MTLLSLLTRPISVSCILLFGVAPVFNPNLWAASRAGVKASGQTNVQQAFLSEEKAQWALFREISDHFRDTNPEESLKKANVFLLRWPRSPMSDSVRLMAASCASKLERYEQALILCNDIQDQSLKQQVLAQRLQWLYALNRYEEAYQMGLNASFDDLNAERRAWSHYYMAQSLYQDAFRNKAKNKDFSENDIAHIQQAHSLYTSSQEIIGYMAALGRAQSAETIGLMEVAANSYLQASELPGSDWAKCKYLAARLFAESDPIKALPLCESLLEKENPWRESAAFLWMELCLKTHHSADILKHLDWVKFTSKNDSYAALYFLGNAQVDAGQKEAAIDTFIKLVRESHNVSKADLEAYTKPSMVHLADLFTASRNPAILVELNELVAQKEGRSKDYFYVCLKAGKLFDELNNKEGALEQYSHIVIEAPQVSWVGEALLRKGLLEADKNLWAQSWSSLDLYLRCHSTEEGLAQAWPVFLRVTSSLQDYAASASFNKQRFLLVLDRLKAVNCSEAQKTQWICDETERLHKESPAQAELLLLAVQARAPAYFLPDRELLMSMSRAAADGSVDSFIARGRAAINREKTNPALLEIRYAKSLRDMAIAYPQQSFKAQEVAAASFFSAFEKNASIVSKEDLIWAAQWIQSYLQQSDLGPGAWPTYFVDPIYDRVRMVYQPLNLDSEKQKWADRGSLMLQGLLNRGQADPASRFLLARLQWASNDFKGCTQTLVTLQGSMFADEKQKDSKTESLIRPYLVYDCGARLLSGDIEGAMIVYDHLVPLMEKENDKTPLSSLQITLARACVKTAESQVKHNEIWYKRALELYELANTQATPEFEPIYIESSIEEALLLGQHLAKEDPINVSYSNLLKVKRHYVEADTGHTQNCHEWMKSHPEAKSCWHSYVILLDALLAQYQAAALLANKPEEEEKEEAKVYLAMAQNLYQMLLNDKHGMTPYLKEMSNQGVVQVQNLEKN